MRTDNQTVAPSEVVAQLWGPVQARDWVGVGDLLAEDFVLEWPNDLVRLRGRANSVEFKRKLSGRAALLRGRGPVHP